MKTLAVLNQKGGVGKTTLATNLAAAAHLSGLRTLVIDLDRQGSALDWAAARKDGSKLEGLSTLSWDKPLPLARFRELVRGYEFIVLDGPPRLSDVVRSAALCADTWLVPVTPGGYDLWALAETLPLLLEADALRVEMGRPQARRFFVVNRASRNLLTSHAPQTLAAYGQVAPVTLGQRVSFAASATEGESVLTAEPQGAAARELSFLFAFLFPSKGAS